MREPEPFERPPRQKIDRPPGPYDAIKFDGPCGLQGCRFDRKHYYHYHPRWWVEQKEPRIEIPISMADPGETSLYPRQSGKQAAIDESVKRAEAAGERVIRVGAVTFTLPAGAAVTHHDGSCDRTDCSHTVPHHHADFENRNWVWFDKPNYEQPPSFFRDIPPGYLSCQKPASPEIRSRHRLPARVSRRRRLIGWAMLAATAAGWIVRLLL